MSNSFSKLNETHSPDLQSWVTAANEVGCEFPIQNLPFCVFRHGDEPATIGVGIGDQVLDLRRCAAHGFIGDSCIEAVSQGTLNQLMALPSATRGELRGTISQLLTATDSPPADSLKAALLSQHDVQLQLPCHIGDYTDFYASLFHATNVGSMFRPNNPLLPNYKHIPIGYHGRASSVVASGTPFHRPLGQLSPVEEGGQPTRGECKLLDYELEVACYIATGNELGQPISITQAEEHIFGLSLLNDWSARDIQKWEYQPLGPFLAKSFLTTVSPWIVTLEALAPFRCPAFERASDDPQPLDYLQSESNLAAGGFDLKLEVFIATAQMREQKLEPHQLSSGSFNQMYWTLAQMLTHHSSNGCNLRPGDMLGSGTVSNADRGSRGCMLELTWDGGLDNPLPGSQRTPIQLPTGEERKFLADGDEVIIRGYCESEQHRRIGFGECTGTVLPAVQN